MPTKIKSVASLPFKIIRKKRRDGQFDFGVNVEAVEREFRGKC